MTHSNDSNRRDQGSILPMVLVMTVVLSAVVVSLASYVSAGLRFSTVVEDRADRLAAADGGLRYGIERLALQSYAGCFTALGNTGYGSRSRPLSTNPRSPSPVARREPASATSRVGR